MEHWPDQEPESRFKGAMPASAALSPRERVPSSVEGDDGLEVRSLKERHRPTRAAREQLLEHAERRMLRLKGQLLADGCEAVGGRHGATQ